MKLHTDYHTIILEFDDHKTFIQFFHDWRDWWVGLYRNTDYDATINYICILPTLGVKVWQEKKIEIPDVLFLHPSVQYMLEGVTIFMTDLAEAMTILAKPLCEASQTFINFVDAVGPVTSDFEQVDGLDDQVVDD
jgi:hypothetical protein